MVEVYDLTIMESYVKDGSCTCVTYVFQLMPMQLCIGTYM